MIKNKIKFYIILPVFVIAFGCISKSGEDKILIIARGIIQNKCFVFIK